MAGPWEKYQTGAPAPAGPWVKYQSAAPQPAPEPPAPEDVRGPSGIPGGASGPAAPQKEIDPGYTAPTYVAQQADRGLADATGAPVDILTALGNAALFGSDKIANLFGGSVPVRIKDPFMGSEWIANHAAKAYEGAGGHVVRPDEVSGPARLAGGAARGATATLLPGFGLASRPVQEAAGPLARTFERATVPYKTEAGATLTRDAVAGAGASTANQAYNEHAPDWVRDNAYLDPLAQALSAITGAVGGAGLTALAEGAVKGTGALAKHLTGTNVDRSLPLNPDTGQPYNPSSIDTAARIWQEVPSNKPQAVANVEQANKDFSRFASPTERPTVGMMADDVGTAVQENKLRTQNAEPFANRDAARVALADQRLSATAPKGANARDFTNEATRQYDTRLRGAEEGVKQAETAQAAAKQDIESQNAALRGYQAGQPQASEALSGEFNAARKAGRTAKNDAYAAKPDATPVENGNEFLSEAVKRIDAEMPRAEKMAGGAYADIAGRVRALTADGQPVTYGDIKALRAQISEARKNAVAASGQSAAGSGADVQRLDQLGRVVNHLADQVNPEAARYYADEYAPRFKQGRAGEYGAAIDRAARTGGESSATAPSQFAGKFLNTPENAASLKRALTPETSKQPRLPGATTGEPSSGMFPQSEQNITDWMMGDLAKSGVLTDNGQVRFDRFRKWADKNQQIIDQFPQLRQTVDKELASARKGGLLSKELADQVAAAKEKANVTKESLLRSALQSAIGNSPEYAVASIMGSGDPERRMAEMVGRLKGQPDALDGLKQAVQDWIRSKAESTTPVPGYPEANRLSPGSFEKLFKKTEKTLAKLYTPKEMQALQQSRRLIAAEGKLRTMASQGSNTMDKIMAQMKSSTDQKKKIIEAAFKAKYGVLVGGSYNRTLNVLRSALPDNSEEINNIMLELTMNPDFALKMWNMPLKDIGSPKWNARLQQLLAVAAAGRGHNDQAQQ